MTASAARPRPYVPGSSNFREILLAEKTGYLDLYDTSAKWHLSIQNEWRQICREQRVPFIVITKRRKFAFLECNATTLGDYHSGLVLSREQHKKLSEYIRRMDGRDRLSVASIGSQSVTVSHVEVFPACVLASTIIDIFTPQIVLAGKIRESGLTEAQFIMSEPDPPYPPSLTNGVSVMREASVEFIEDQDTASMGILTDAETPEAFLSTCAAAIAGKIGDDAGGDWETRLSYWLPQIVEVACKLKGYKADVKEKRVISAGDFSPAAFARAMQAGPGLVLPLPGSNGNGKAAEAK